MLNPMAQAAIIPSEHASGDGAPGGRPLRVVVEEGWDRGVAQALWERASTASVFNHPVLWAAAADCYGAGRRILSVTAHAAGEPCGYWLLWEKRMGPKDGCALILEPVGARHADYVMPLVEEGREPAPVIAAMLAALRARLSATSLLLWPKAGAIAAADAAVAAAFPSARYLVHRHIRRCPRAGIVGLDAIMARWSRRRRAHFRRNERRLEALGALSCEVAPSRQEIIDGIETMFSIHRVNWNARGGQSEFDEPENRRFLMAIAAALPLEMMHFSRLRLDDKTLNCEFSFVLDGELQFYKGSFDLAYGAYSPGMVHTARVLEWAKAQGIHTLDFMQGQEEYKYLWADGVRETVSHAVSPVGALPVWLWNTKLRKMIVEYKV